MCCSVLQCVAVHKFTYVYIYTYIHSHTRAHAHIHTHAHSHNLLSHTHRYVPDIYIYNIRFLRAPERYIYIYIQDLSAPPKNRQKTQCSKHLVSREKVSERWGAGVETPKNVRGEIGGWGRVPFNETYAPSLSTIYDGA